MLSQQAIATIPARPISNMPAPIPQEMQMPYALTVTVTGFIGMPENQIQALERHITEFFFFPPERVGGAISIYRDMYGDMSLLYRRMQLFFFSLRSGFSPRLNFKVEFNYV